MADPRYSFQIHAAESQEPDGRLLGVSVITVAADTLADAVTHARHVLGMTARTKTVFWPASIIEFRAVPGAGVSARQAEGQPRNRGEAAS